MTFKIETIKNADRSLVKDLDGVYTKLNDHVKKHDHSNVKIVWAISSDEMGPCLEANITFKNPLHCLKFCHDVYELQEKSDHHSNFSMENFNQVRVLLSTHHPIAGITHVDVKFAEYLIDMINQY